MPKSILSKTKFICQWLRHFAADVEKKKIDKYVKDQYIWHVFSFDLLNRDDFLMGDAARQAYNHTDKSACVFCDVFGPNGVTDILLEAYETAENIDDQITELYVMAKDYSWTYIKTHEQDLCGPYFMSR